MIIVKQVQRIDGRVVTLEVPSESDLEINAQGLTALPAVVDPHVHFRTPGLTHKEDWSHASRAAINGGCTMVFDMPNVLPPTITRELLVAKKALIDAELKQSGIPLRYELYIGADKAHLDQLAMVKDQVVGIKVFMGCSTGNLVIDDDASLERVFSLAAQHHMLVAVHAEDEAMLNQNKHAFFDSNDYACHSLIRDVEVAVRAVEKALALAKKYGTRLYILHVSSREEIDLIRQAKADGVTVFAETTPHHLYFDTSCYTTLKGRACVNPALREMAQHDAIIQGIREGVIDTMGSDHAPHTVAEKDLPYGQCPSGMPGIEFMLPVLLTAHAKGELTLDQVVGVTSRRARHIFKLPLSDDWVLVDLKLSKCATKTASKCGWSPYFNHTLTGWPRLTILDGHVFECQH